MNRLTLALLLLGMSVNASEPALVIRAPKPDWPTIRAEQTIDQVASFKTAYDAENFYVWVKVIDPSPLRNNAGVVQELFKGGDALAFCFGPVGGQGKNQRVFAALVQGKPVVVALRPQWPQKQPYTFTSVGDVTMDFVAPLPDAQAIFDKTADGYIARVRFPWKSLGLLPQDGAEFPFDVQVIFSDPSGSANEATVWWHSDGAEPMATTDLVTEAKLYPELWGRARFTATDAKTSSVQRANPDDDDQLAALAGPGEPITFQLDHPSHVSIIIRRADGWVVRELLRAWKLPAGKHTVYWDGRDRGGMPVPPGEYHYRIGIFDELKVKFAGSVGNSGRPVWRTPDGLGSIGGSHGGPSAVAAGNNGIYMLHSGEEGQYCLRQIDPATGKAKWFANIGIFSTGYAVTEAGEFVYLLHDADRQASLTRLNVSDGKRVQKSIPLGKIKPRGLAIIDGKAYFSEPAANRIGVIDLETGKALADIAIPAPLGLANLNNNEVLVCSSNAVVRVDLTTGRQERVVAGLDNPRAVAVDAAGNIYVTSRQIQKFDRQGKLLAMWGKPGGRGNTAVPFDPMAFRTLTGITVDPQGNIWAVEPESPRRFIKLSPTGQWLEDFYGPTGFATAGVDLDDVSRIIYQPDKWSCSFAEARVDYNEYAKRPGDPVGTWKIEALHYLSQNGEDNTAQPDLIRDTAKMGYSSMLMFTATNGRRYLWKAKGVNLALWISDNGRWRPIVALREVDKTYVIWQDANGDGLVQETETSPRDKAPSGWTWIDRDLTIRGVVGDWRPAGFDERGVPDYLKGEFVPRFTPGAVIPDVVRIDPGANRMHSPPAPGGVHYHAGNAGTEQGRHFWDRASELRIAKFVGDKLEWVIGHHDGRFRHNGDSIMVMNLAGELDGVLLATEVNANFIAYTSDGLTLGWVSRNADGRPATTGPTAWYIENVQPGLFIKDPKTGKRLLIGMTTEDVRILEISGVFDGDLQRIDGKLKLASAYPRVPFSPGYATVPYQTYTFSHVRRWLGPDGDDWKWQRHAPAVSVYENRALIADVRLRRDAGLLSVFADVISTNPLPVAPVGSSLGKVPGVELVIGGKTIFLAVHRTPTKVVANASLPEIKVGVKERVDGAGWRLEADIPLTVFPELATESVVTYRRPERKVFTETKLDLLGPFPLNVIIHRSATDSVAWTPNGGLANAEVAITWQPAAGVAKWNVYRSATGNPAQAQRIATAESNHTDRPGAGTWHYWLAPVINGSEGQWFGPLLPAAGKVDFPAFVPLPAKTDARVDIFPSDTLVVNVAGRPQPVVITAPTNLPVGKEFSVAGLTGRISPVAVTLYGARADVIENAIPAVLTVDPDAPEVGKPATEINWSGQGTITHRRVGRGGYVLFNWNGPAELARRFGLTFSDSFRGGWLDAKYTARHPAASAVVSGKRGAINGVAIDGSKSGLLKLDPADTEPHRVTLLLAGNSPPLRIRAGDLTLVERPAGLVNGVVQFSFVGPLAVKLEQTGPGQGRLAKPILTAVFLD